MAYTNIDFISKAALRRALADGKHITVYDPGVGLAHIPENGRVNLEGPHYPKAHTWYGTGTMKDGVLVKIR